MLKDVSKSKRVMGWKQGDSSCTTATQLVALVGDTRNILEPESLLLAGNQL